MCSNNDNILARLSHGDQNLVRYRKGLAPVNCFGWPFSSQQVGYSVDRSSQSAAKRNLDLLVQQVAVTGPDLGLSSDSGQDTAAEFDADPED